MPFDDHQKKAKFKAIVIGYSGCPAVIEIGNSPRSTNTPCRPTKEVNIMYPGLAFRDDGFNLDRTFPQTRSFVIDWHIINGRPTNARALLTIDFRFWFYHSLVCRCGGDSAEFRLQDGTWKFRNGGRWNNHWTCPEYQGGREHRFAVIDQKTWLHFGNFVDGLACRIPRLQRIMAAAHCCRQCMERSRQPPQSPVDRTGQGSRGEWAR